MHGLILEEGKSSYIDIYDAKCVSSSYRSKECTKEIWVSIEKDNSATFRRFLDGCYPLQMQFFLNCFRLVRFLQSKKAIKNVIELKNVTIKDC